MQKKYVGVDVSFSADGLLTPTAIIWDDDHKYEISRIIEVLPRRYSKVGGIGERYEIQIGRQRTYLYRELNKWFVEAKCDG